MITLFKVCDLWGLRPGIDYKHNAQKNTIRWRNGSKTIFKELEFKPSDPDFHRLGSTEYTDAFIDEAMEITEKAFDIVNTRIRWMLDEYGLTPKILMTCNPGFNWIRNKYVREKEGSKKVLQAHQKYVRALVTDNPDQGFSALYISQLQKIKSEYDRARLLDGDWDAEPKTGGEFYKSFDREKQAIPNLFFPSPATYNDHLPLHATWDFNVHPYVTCNVWQIPIWSKERKVLIQLMDIHPEFPNNRTKSACRIFKEDKFKRHTSGLFIYGDPAGKTEDTRTEQGENDFSIIMAELRDYKPSKRVDTKAPAVVARGNFMNALFDGDIPGVEIYFANSCFNTIADYTNLKEEQDGTKSKKKIKDPKTLIFYEKYGHPSDANDYFLCYVLRNEYLDFIKGGKRDIAVTYGDNKTSTKNTF